MSELSDDEVSLNALFEPAKKVVYDIEDGRFATKELQPRIQSSIESLHKVTRLVNKLQLYSSNELIEDIPTNSLQFLLVPCFLGIFHQNLMVEPAEKLDELRKAIVYLRNFLGRLKNLTLINDKLSWEDDDLEEKTATAKPKPSAEEIRKTKLERHKRKAELKMTEARVQKQLEAVSIDEGNLRELYITQLLFWTERSFEELQSIEEELPLLRMMAQRVASGAPRPPPPMKSVPALKPFVITRDVQQKQVLGKGYPAIPTMTVDEWYHKKFGCGHNAPPQSSEPPPAKSPPSDEEEDDDEARAKAMRWDEYKDDHRRGWGNMHNKG